MLLDPSGLPGAKKVAQVPLFVDPELATLVQEAPCGDGWSHEVKFDGYRALARIENEQVQIRSRNNKDWTSAYAILADELASLPVDTALIDGEVVIQSPDGKTSFEELRHIARGSQEPRGFAGRLVYYAFDLLFLNDHDLLDVPLEKRRGLLRRLLEATGSGGRILFSDRIPGDGAMVLQQACALGLEGVVSKRATSRYRPGVRGPDWVKTKCRHEQEFVIGGFTDPEGTRVGFGALLLGVNDTGGLRYVSKVGTGFDDELLRELGARLRTLEVDDPPFAANIPKVVQDVHWVRPELVAQVSFLEWTSGGGIRHPSFKGLREDKPARQVVAETPPAEGNHD